MQIYSNRAMRREISSSTVIINKMFVPLVFGLVIPVFMFFFLGLNIFSFGILLLVMVYIAFAVLVIRYFLNLKKIEMIDTGLFISEENFGKNIEIFVSFEEIESVSPMFLNSKGDHLTIKFKNSTRFGTKVSFDAADRFFKIFEHPLVKELNDKAKDARLQAQTKMQHP